MAITSAMPSPYSSIIRPLYGVDSLAAVIISQNAYIVGISRGVSWQPYQPFKQLVFLCGLQMFPYTCSRCLALLPFLLFFVVCACVLGLDNREAYGSKPCEDGNT